MADEILTPMKLYLQSSNGLESLDGMTASLTQAVTAALRRYDKDSPRVVPRSFAGDGTSLYDLSAKAAGWVEGFSVVRSVDFPWTAGEDCRLRLDEWEVYEDADDGDTLHLVGGNAEEDDTILVSITIPWTEGTVPTRHIDAVAKLGAAHVCRMMAARTLQAGESTYSVDRFHAPTASQNWISLAKMYEGQYEEAMGMGSDGDTGAGSSGTGAVRAACGVFPLDTGDRLIEVDDD